MESFEMISCQIIAAVGSARGMFVEAIQQAKQGNFSEAENLIKQGEESMNEGHRAHMDVLTRFANQENIPFDLLLVHAEDQMMSAETIKIVAEEFISLYKNSSKADN